MASEHASKIPALIPLEKAGPKGYIRYVFPLELSNDYDLEEIYRILKAGFEAAKERIPTLACEGVPDPEAKQAGVLKLHKFDDYESITYKDLRAPEAFPHTFQEIKAKKFPVSAFPGQLLCRRYTWPSPGERVVVADIQANFIRGGLLLSCCFFHVFGDAKSYYTWLETWAEECRRLQGLESGERNHIPDAFFADREKHIKPSGKNPGRAEDHPEIVVFYFSKDNLTKLKADASPANATEPTDVPYISTNDAISALMWRSVMSAQFPIEELEGDPTSIFNIAIDGRTRTDPAVHQRVLGNWLGWVAQQMPIRKMLATANLADIAAVIRKAMLRLTDQYVDNLSTLFESVEDVNRVVATAFLDVPGFNCVQTSWINLELYGLDWGKTLGHKILAVRSPDIGIINGGSAVLPVMPDGGIEMLIGVESKCLPRLLSDPLLAKYTEAITF
ncbi:hypothetical protein AAE478_010416 [Parahypoxylon ruwenzoriense]